MVMGYGNDWDLREEVDTRLREAAAERPAETLEQPTLEGFEVPSELPEIVERSIKERIATLEQMAWEPEQAANDGDRVLFDKCPECGVLASTIAVQLTYYHMEPTTLHMWCLRGHAWKWNEIEGRRMEHPKWQR